MIKINDEIVDIQHFPDRTQKLDMDCKYHVDIDWYYEDDSELATLIFITKHLREIGAEYINLYLPYVPNSRFDRKKKDYEVFTLKYFADVINWLDFDEVVILDPHSDVTSALLNKVRVNSPGYYIKKAISKIETDDAELILYFPDSGACKRYSSMFPKYKYIYGNKKRRWEDVYAIIEEVFDGYDVEICKLDKG